MFEKNVFDTAMNIENEFSITIYSWDLLSRENKFWTVIIKEYLRDQFSRISIHIVFTLFLIFWLRTRKGKGLYLIIDTRHSGFLHLLHRNLCKYIAAIAALSFNPPFIPRPTVQGEAMANKVIVFWQSGGTPAHDAEFQIKWVRNLILIDTPRFDTRESLSSSLYVLHDIRKTSEFGEKTRTILQVQV